MLAPPPRPPPPPPPPLLSRPMKNTLIREAHIFIEYCNCDVILLYRRRANQLG